MLENFRANVLKHENSSVLKIMACVAGFFPSPSPSTPATQATQVRALELKGRLIVFLLREQTN